MAVGGVRSQSQSSSPDLNLVCLWGKRAGYVVAEIARKSASIRIPARLHTNPNQGGTKKRAYAEWSKGQRANILASEVYKGVWTYGMRSTNGRGRGADPISINAIPIMDPETCETAQARRKRNPVETENHGKSTNLLSARMRCGHCGASFNGEANKANGFRDSRCLAIHKGDMAHKCNIPSFRVDHADAVVWDWIVRLLINLEALEEGIRTHVAQNEKELTPLRGPLAVADDMLKESKEQLARLLDLHIAGDFSKDARVDRKRRLEASIRALESAESNRTCQRQILEALDVRVNFAIESGEKVIYARCVLGNSAQELGISSITGH